MSDQDNILEGITAGIDKLSKEELEQIKALANQLPTDDPKEEGELTDDDIDFSMGGFPSTEIGKEKYDAHMPQGGGHKF